MRTPGRCSAGPAHSQAIVPGRRVTPWCSCTSSLLPRRPRRSRSRWVGRRRGRFARRREGSYSQKGEGHQQLLSADLVSACGHFKRKMALALIDQALVAIKKVANLRPARHSFSKLPMLAQVAPHLCQRGSSHPSAAPTAFDDSAACCVATVLDLLDGDPCVQEPASTPCAIQARAGVAKRCLHSRADEPTKTAPEGAVDLSAKQPAAPTE